MTKYYKGLLQLETLGYLPESKKKAKKRNSAYELNVLFEKYKSKYCVYCGSEDNLTVDHYIPKCKAGYKFFSNKVIACNTCNQEKADMLPLNFILKRLNNEGNS